MSTPITTTGACYFADLLDAYGIGHVFYVPGVLREALTGLPERGITSVSTHGEKAAAYMADGYARVSRRPGICMAQEVGAANLASGLKDAFMASSPVVALTGGPTPDTRYRQVYQEVRDTALFDGVTKWNASVDLGTRFPELMEQALRVATTGAPGPVHLEIQGHGGQVTEEPTDVTKGIDTRFRQVPPFRPVADTESILAARRALATAERPVLIAGGGVIWSGAEAELLRLAETLSIPVATSLNAKAAIADRHPLAVGVCGHYSRPSANQVISEADLVMFVGSRTGSMVTNNWRVPTPGARIIHLDLNPEELGRHYRTETALLGDARATLARLLEGLDARDNATWTGRAAELVAAWRAETKETLESDDVPIRPERLAAEIGHALPDDGVVVVDTLQASVWAGTMLALRGPRQRFARCAGSLGWGLSAAIGAKCAVGDRPLICFTGDGGLYYHLSELETAARHHVNLVVVVNNNSAYACEARVWDGYGGREAAAIYDSWKFGDVDFARIAKELGCDGIRVERPLDLSEALQTGLSGDRPVVIDAVTDPGPIHPRGWAPEA